MMEQKHKGAHAELLAATWLLGLGYEVFRNVSPHGKIDIVGIKDGIVEYFDVKSADYKSIPYGNEEQLRAGIKYILVRPNGSCEIHKMPERQTLLCKSCGEPFIPRKNHQTFCGNPCRGKYKLANRMPDSGAARL